MRSLPTHSPDCCVEPPAVSPEHYCFWPDIQAEYAKLCRRHNCLLTTRQRVLELAEPKFQKPKYHSECVCEEGMQRKTQILHTDRPVHTRTEQLAYPQVSSLKMLQARDVYATFSNKRKVTVNRTMRKSLFSLYSRLANTQPPQKPVKPKPWNKREWETHMTHIQKLAKPKPTSRGKRPKNSSDKKGKGKVGMPEKTPRRYLRLCKPKKVFGDHTPKEWHLTAGCRKYVPTVRVLKLSRPRIHEPFDPNAAYTVKKSALGYKASPRIKELAKPTQVAHKKENRDDAYKVPPRALKGKFPKHVLDLSAPKSHTDIHSRPNPYKISAAALKAKATPRIIQLSKPRKGNAK